MRPTHDRARLIAHEGNRVPFAVRATHAHAGSGNDLCVRRTAQETARTPADEGPDAPPMRSQAVTAASALTLSKHVLQ
jgi:hypothetical protein